jgi:hypothetical protein
MERLTSDKKVSDMSMIELAHNSCYADDKRNARYRDYDLDIDSRQLVRNLMKDMCGEDLSDPALISLFFWFAMPYCHKTSLLLYLSLFQNKKDRPFCQSFMLTLYHTSNGQNGQLYLFSF